MRIGLCLTLLPILATPSTAQQPVRADIVIRNATLFDGTGDPGRKGDLAINDDRIVAVGEFTAAGRPTVIDATGLFVTPGFIDLHTHCDAGSLTVRSNNGRKNRNYLWQGVTTVVTGNCGAGPVDVGVFYNVLDQAKVGTNVAHLVPHNAVRSKVMGNSDRPPTVGELRAMKAVVAAGMRDGAWGMSTGLIYNPGTYSKTAELVELATEVAGHGGIYASHIRDESTGLLTSIEETLTIGREANLPVHISHFKSSGRQAWGNAPDAVAMIREARDAGQQVTADQYPYFASSTNLQATLVPPRFREGTRQNYLERLDHPEIGPKIREAILEKLGDDGGTRILIAGHKAKPEWNGLRLGEAAEKLGNSLLDTVLQIERNGGAQIVHFSMREEDVRLIMKQDFVTTASDGGVQLANDTSPHPRNYGTFPRKIGHYAIEEKLIPVERAIRSATGLPADILGLTDRGYLKPGQLADVVIFDPKSFRDRATFEKPHQLPSGLRYVFVNGKAVIDNGRERDVLAGRPLRHPPKRQN